MHWTLPARRQRGERGAAAVEFALVVPLLLTIVFGLFTTGMTFSDHLSATNAVREGARYGAASDIAASTWTQSVKDRVKQVYFNAGAAAPTDDQICVRLIKSDGSTYVESTSTSCGAAPTAPATMAAGSCAVMVWMQRPAKITLLLVPALNLTVRGDSVAFYGRESGTTCTAS
jgi:Flp pilus assembly protein TadG